MADPPRSPDPREDTGLGPNRGAAGGRPRWVVVLGIIIVTALVALMVFLHLTGSLGPGLH
jgi:hypothetical protein